MLSHPLFRGARRLVPGHSGVSRMAVSFCTRSSSSSSSGLPFGRAAPPRPSLSQAEAEQARAAIAAAAQLFDQHSLEPQEIEQGAVQAYEALVAAINARDADQIRGMCAPDTAEAILDAVVAFDEHWANPENRKQSQAASTGSDKSPKQGNEAKLHPAAARLERWAAKVDQQAARLKADPRFGAAGSRNTEFNKPALQPSDWSDQAPSGDQPDYMRDILEPFTTSAAAAERAQERLTAHSENAEFRPDPVEGTGGPKSFLHRVTGVDQTRRMPLMDLHTSLDVPEVREGVEGRAAEGHARAAADLERWDRLTEASFRPDSPDSKATTPGHCDPYFRSAIQFRQKLTGEVRQPGQGFARLAPHEREWLGKLSQAPRLEYRIPGELEIPSLSQGHIFATERERRRFADRISFLSLVVGLPGMVNEPSWDALLFQLTAAPMLAMMIRAFLYANLQRLGLLENPMDRRSLATVPASREDLRWLTTDALMYPGWHMSAVLPTAPLPIPGGSLFQVDMDKAGFFHKLVLKMSTPRFRRMYLHREFATGVVSRMLEQPDFPVERDDHSQPWTRLRPEIRDQLLAQLGIPVNSSDTESGDSGKKMPKFLGKIQLLAPEAFDLWFDSLELHPEAVRQFLPLEWEAARHAKGDWSAAEIGRIHPSAFLDPEQSPEDASSVVGSAGSAGRARGSASMDSDVDSDADVDSAAGNGSVLVRSRVLRSQLVQVRMLADGRLVESPAAASQASDVGMEVCVGILAGDESLESSLGAGTLDGPYKEVGHELTLATPLRKQGEAAEMDWVVRRLDSLPPM